MRLFARRQTKPLSERVFRVKKMGFLRRNLAEGKKEYVSALKEMTDKTKMMNKLLSEREKLLRAKRITPESKEMLVRMDNTIAGVREMIRHAIQSQQRAKEMILHAEKEIGVPSIARRAKKAA